LLLSLLLQSGLLLLPLKNRAHGEICRDGTPSPKLLVHEPARAKVTIHSTVPRQLLLLVLLVLRLLLLLLLLLLLRLLVLLLLLLLILLLQEE